MLGSWGPKASWYLRHVRIGPINSHLSSYHISSKLAKQPSFWSLASSRSNSRPSGSHTFYKTHTTPPPRHARAQEYATFRGRSVINWRKRTILVAGIGALGYYAYYELSIRWAGNLLLTLDEDFPLLDWDDPLHAMVYFHHLMRVCYKYLLLLQPTITSEPIYRNMEEGELVYDAITLFIRLPREHLDWVLQRRMVFVQREGMDSVTVSTLVACQCEMHNLMKETAHQVHRLLAEHPARWESRTLGYNMLEIIGMVVNANARLLKIVKEHDILEILTICHMLLQADSNEQASNAITTGNEEES